MTKNTDFELIILPLYFFFSILFIHFSTLWIYFYRYK